MASPRRGPTVGRRKGRRAVPRLRSRVLHLVRIGSRKHREGCRAHARGSFTRRMGSRVETSVDDRVPVLVDSHPYRGAPPSADRGPAGTNARLPHRLSSIHWGSPSRLCWPPALITYT